MKFLLLLCLMISSAFAGFYDLKETSIDGTEYKLADLKGKAVLVVNIASQCGYTPQLEKLETLHKKYKDKGLVVLGVPTNDFGGQTPENDQDMKTFCQKNYNVSFPLLKKRTVQGKEKRELYKFLTEQTEKKYQGEVGWNFEKFLIDKKGMVAGRMRSSIDPLDPKMISEIETVLK